jgi:ferric-dicitrate binding protein FerR (iron transport regulator)
MDCTQALLQLNAWLDGEPTSSAESAALEGHLASCAECRAASEHFRVQDAELHRAFARLRSSSDVVAQRVIRDLEPPKSPTQHRASWLLLLAATAAGYLIAIFTWRPAEKAEPVVESPGRPAIAHLALATGPVEVLPPREQNWFACPPATEIVSGAALRTETGTRCEVATQDGSRVRLNGDTQVQFPGVRQVSLSQGQLWSHVAGAGGENRFCVSLPKAKVLAEAGTLNFLCEPNKTVITVVEGQAEVESDDKTTTVQAGQSATLIEGQISDVRQVRDTSLVTAWINELLAAKGPDDPEFTARMNDILAQLGQAKLAHLYEEEIRRLGDHCVLPLVRFLESSRSQGDAGTRQRAAQIVADVAQPRSIGLLIELLADNDPLVRSSAARGLERLTAIDQGRTAKQWQTDSVATCAPTIEAWQQWWAANRNRYPGAVEMKRPLKKG